MSKSHQDEVCEFVREIIAAGTGEVILVASCPELDRRNDKAVEELCGMLRRANTPVEHTRVESFDGQLANIAKVKRLLRP